VSFSSASAMAKPSPSRAVIIKRTRRAGDHTGGRDPVDVDDGGDSEGDGTASRT
jgi:hypothetical protein